MHIHGIWSASSQVADQHLQQVQNRHSDCNSELSVRSYVLSVQWGTRDKRILSLSGSTLTAGIYQETSWTLWDGWLQSKSYTTGCWSESQPFRLSWWGNLKCRITESVQKVDRFFNVFVSNGQDRPLCRNLDTFLSKFLHKPGVKH